jgi:hypothetical protein
LLFPVKMLGKIMEKVKILHVHMILYVLIRKIKRSLHRALGVSW